VSCGPGKMPVDLIQAIRSVCPESSIIALSSGMPLDARVALLDAGADDLIIKPFSYFELAARVRTTRRRSYVSKEGTIQCGELSLNRYERTACRAGRQVDLTAREFRLLEFLVRNNGHIVSRKAILQHVWFEGSGDGAPVVSAKPPAECVTPAQFLKDRSLKPATGCAAMTNIVDVYVNYLRQKLGDSKEKRLIRTVRGIGYRLGEGALFPPSTAILTDERQLQTC
jgi:two-component system, OmpR family, response regulator